MTHSDCNLVSCLQVLQLMSSAEDSQHLCLGFQHYVPEAGYDTSSLLLGKTPIAMNGHEMDMNIKKINEMCTEICVVGFS